MALYLSLTHIPFSLGPAGINIINYVTIGPRSPWHLLACSMQRCRSRAKLRLWGSLSHESSTVNEADRQPYHTESTRNLPHRIHQQSPTTQNPPAINNLAPSRMILSRRQLAGSPNLLLLRGLNGFPRKLLSSGLSSLRVGESLTAVALTSSQPLLTT